jgi:hypothetical protein
MLAGRHRTGQRAVRPEIGLGCAASDLRLEHRTDRSGPAATIDVTPEIEELANDQSRHRCTDADAGQPRGARFGAGLGACPPTRPTADRRPFSALSRRPGPE